ncbi:iron donor protein CyaY [Andreprevotia sp. IGB-42]|uniref:iron donor protein CyaY n=1 Tax=Andreprevotia sp. IGB-42 TaxID=2497473 RepID=UPI00135B6ED9|nr:iron donor protein CyaY [Andreprevotia sp. IGB-42]
MTESEFLDLSDAVFAQIDTALEDADLDVETLLSGNVFEIEFDDGSKIIVNRHVPNHEMWLAARNGGFHYRLVDGQWRNTRGDGELFADLAASVSLHAGVDFSF